MAGQSGHTLILVGHSCGCDTGLRVASKLSGKVDLLVCADPVSKSRLIPPPRPQNIVHLIVIDALPARRNRSDHIKRLGQVFGGTLRRRLAGAHTTIIASLNHAAFAKMLHTPSEQGPTALDFINQTGPPPANRD